MLYLWNEMYSDSVISKLLNAKEGSKPDYFEAVSQLIEFAENNCVSNDIIKEYIIRKICESSNIFNILCQNKNKLGSIIDVALEDISVIKRELLDFDWHNLAYNLGVLSLKGYKKGNKSRKYVYGFENSILEIMQCDKTAVLLDKLIKHVNIFGVGKQSAFCAFNFKKGELVPLAEYDEIYFDDLINIDYQKNILIENTSEFLRGNAANNILLCGSMGTGKSSSIKALLTLFNKERLKIVELSKLELDHIEELINILKSNNGKYIIFLDDLSFEGEDNSYKHLKAVLDGSLENRPNNILFYATSNRRNLVRDTWNDRAEDINAQDTLNEKYSLTERFGIKLFFASYDQNEYLAIIEQIFNSQGIEFTEEAQKSALLWEKDYHGRSGRTASNFAYQYIESHKNN